MPEIFPLATHSADFSFSARPVLVIIASFSRCYFHTLAPSAAVVL